MIIVDKICLKGMSGDELKSWCLEAGQPSYIGQQLFEWMYRHGISSFEDMLNVHKSFRNPGTLLMGMQLALRSPIRGRVRLSKVILFGTITICVLTETGI